MAMDRMSGWLALREDGRTPNRRPHRVAARAQQVGPQRLAIGIQRSAVLEDEMLVRISGQEEAQIALSLPRRLAPHDPEQRLKLLIHRLDGFRRLLEIKSMHDAVRTRYGNSKCRRPPARADMPPHYKHGRLSRPQPFAGAAMVTIAALTTPNVIVFLSDIDRSVCWCRESAGLAEALRRSPRRGISRQDQCDEAAVSAPCCQRPELASNGCVTVPAHSIRLTRPG